MKIKWFVLVFLLVILPISSIASAHVPRTAEGNHSLETAMFIEDPIKSWAIYSELGNGQIANYYKMDLDEGDRLYLSIITPEDQDFIPNMVIIGPGIQDMDTIPNFINRPENHGAKLVPGVPGEREYEPFTPGSYYHPTRFDRRLSDSGTYYVVVYNPEEIGGKYALAVGYRESWTPLEWVRLPIDVVNIRIWEGQSLPLIFSPLIFTIALGSIWVKKELGIPDDIKEWSLVTSGLLYMGTGAMMVMQILISSLQSNPGALVIVTIFFAFVPLFMGYKILIKSKEELDRETRSKLVLYGFLGLLFWAGLIIGPVIVLFTGLALRK